MRTYTKVCLLSVLMVLNGSALAEWVYVTENDEVKYYIDDTSLRLNKNIRSGWGIMNFKEPLPTGEKSFRLLSEYDCKNIKTRIITLTTHSGLFATGRVMASGPTQNSPFSDVAPYSGEMEALKFICSK